MAKTKKDEHREKDEISEVLKDTKKLTAILQAGIRAALLEHKKFGNPVCEWRDGKVVWIPPEEIPV